MLYLYIFFTDNLTDNFVKNYFMLIIILEGVMNNRFTMLYSNKRSMLPTPPPPPRFPNYKPKISNENTNISLATIQKPDNPKVKWGEPVWFLFHTLAHKVKDAEFANIKNELFANIVSICYNLPCPKCAKHATEYMKKINIHSIQTKEDLKKMLFVFHNNVNREKGYPMFEFDKLDEKYEKANTKNIIYHFINQFNVKDFNVNMINSNLQRNMFLNKFKVWLSQNIQHFDI